MQDTIAIRGSTEVASGTHKILYDNIFTLQAAAKSKHSSKQNLLSPGVRGLPNIFTT